MTGSRLLWRASAGAALVLASAAACTSVEGLTGGGPADAGAPDATTDAVLEASTTDAPDSRDARLSCGDAHWVCDDFDRNGQALDATWSVDFGSGTLAIGAVDPSTPSPPSSLVADMDIDATALQYISREYSQGTAGLRCRVAFRVVSAFAQGANVFHVNLRTGNGDVRDYFFDVFVDKSRNPPMVGASDYASLSDGAAGSGAGNDFGELADRWNTLEIELRAGADGGVGVTFNSTPVTLTKALATDIRQSSSYTYAGVRLGVNASDNHAPWRVLYDDIVCDLL